MKLLTKKYVTINIRPLREDIPTILTCGAAVLVSALCLGPWLDQLSAAWLLSVSKISDSVTDSGMKTMDTPHPSRQVWRDQKGSIIKQNLDYLSININMEVNEDCSHLE